MRGSCDGDCVPGSGVCMVRAGSDCCVRLLIASAACAHRGSSVPTAMAAAAGAIGGGVTRPAATAAAKAKPAEVVEI